MHFPLEDDKIHCINNIIFLVSVIVFINTKNALSLIMMFLLSCLIFDTHVKI